MEVDRRGYNFSLIMLYILSNFFFNPIDAPNIY